MTIEEFEEKANEILESFLQSMDTSEYITDLSKESEDSEYGTHISAGFSFVWTFKGQKLATRMIDRLQKLARKKFPNQDVEIYSHLYQEL